MRLMVMALLRPLTMDSILLVSPTISVDTIKQRPRRLQHPPHLQLLVEDMLEAVEVPCPG